MKKDIRITVLIENTVFNAGLKAEHGLSLWIEYGDKKILFDTGQSDLILQNARTLGIDLAQTDIIILSHGHYDHTGGLKKVLKLAEDARVYFHPSALERKYQFKQGRIREIGITQEVRDLIKKYVKDKKAFHTQKETEVFPGFSITGQVPRKNDFEDTGGKFYLDEGGESVDRITDDQALFIESSKGMIVILGCAHSGVVNTIEHITNLTGGIRIHTIIGGMHLINANDDRIEKTINAVGKYDIVKLYPCHCTGEKAKRKLWQHFPEKCTTCSVGEQFMV